jgi:predicted RNA-binding protein YlqC (UPF0109 family)
MVKDFIKAYTSLIASNPDVIEVSQEKLDDNYYEIIVYCDQDDLGKLIGKSGNMINALKIIINGSKAKDGNFYKIQVYAK